MCITVNVNCSTKILQADKMANIDRVILFKAFYKNSLSRLVINWRDKA